MFFKRKKKKNTFEADLLAALQDKYDNPTITNGRLTLTKKGVDARVLLDFADGNAQILGNCDEGIIHLVRPFMRDYTHILLLYRIEHGLDFISPLKTKDGRVWITCVDV
jgi:hypothetical protein